MVAVLISIIAVIAFSNLGMSTAELCVWITSVIEAKG